MDGSRSWSFEEPYERFTKRIDAEDALIDQRMQWLLIAQGLLFAAVGLSDVSGNPGPSTSAVVGGADTTVRSVIPWVGAIVAILLWLSILAAFLVSSWARRQLAQLYRRWLHEQSTAVGSERGSILAPTFLISNKGLFPQAERRSIGFYAGFIAPLGVPLAFLGGWIYILVTS